MWTLRARKWPILLLLPPALLGLTACGESDRDETAPAITLTLPAEGEPPLSPRQGETVTLSGTIEEGATLEARLNETEVNGLTVTGATWSGTIGGLVVNSTNQIELTAIDSAGNTNTITLSIIHDNTPPTVQSSIPAGGATGVAVSSPITIVFSEALKSESLKLTLIDKDQNLVEVTPAYTPGTMTAVFTPTKELAPATEYTAAPGAADLAGNLLGTQSITFTTAAP